MEEGGTHSPARKATGKQIMEEGTQARYGKVSGSLPGLAPQGVASPRESSHYLDGQYIQPDSPWTILSKGVHLSRRGHSFRGLEDTGGAIFGTHGWHRSHSLAHQDVSGIKQVGLEEGNAASSS